MSWAKWGKDYSTEELIDLLNFCMDEGLSTFDHADIYGDYTTEGRFGEALSKSGIKRESIQLITKCGIQYVGETRDNQVKHYNYSKDYIIWSAEQSLKNLKTNYIDLFLLHRPSPLMHPDEILEAIHKAMEKPRDEDEIEHLFSARSLQTILFFSDKGKVYSQKAFYIPAARRTDCRS